MGGKTKARVSAQTKVLPPISRQGAGAVSIVFLPCSELFKGARCSVKVYVVMLSRRDAETRRRGDAERGRRTPPPIWWGLRCPPIGSHQIAGFDGGGGPLGLIAPDTGHRTQSTPRPVCPRLSASSGSKGVAQGTFALIINLLQPIF